MAFNRLKKWMKQRKIDKQRKAALEAIYIKSDKLAQINYIAIESQILTINKICQGWCVNEEDNLLKLTLIRPEESALRNLVTFNLKSLLRPDGVTKFTSLTSSTDVQQMAERLEALAVYISIRVDTKVVDILIDRCRYSLKHYYKFSDEMISRWFNEVPYFWLIPFIQHNWQPLTRD